jgi:hypothetical protein
LAGISILVAIGNGLVVVAPVPNLRWRPRRLFISIGGRLVAVGPAAPDTAIAIAAPIGSVAPVAPPIGPVRIIAVGTAIAPVRIIAVVTAVAPVTIAPLDIFAFDIAALVDNA